MIWRIFFTRSAEKELARLSNEMQTRIGRAIRSLEQIPMPAKATRLKGRSEFRLRVGDYRILYIIDHRENSVTIVAIGHRREVYR